MLRLNIFSTKNTETGKTIACDDFQAVRIPVISARLLQCHNSQIFAVLYPAARIRECLLFSGQMF